MIGKIKKKYFNSLSLDKRVVSKNIGLSFVAKGISFVISFATVPILLSYLGRDVYGTWLTIFSVVSWISFFDLGLGNGLRNHLTIVFTSGDSKKAQEYISTAYWLLGAFIVISLVFLQFGVFYIDWNKVFKPTVALNENFNIIISICLWGFGGLLVAKLITSILQAQKQVGKGDILIALGGVVSLILLIIASKFESTTKLYYVAYIYSATIPLVLIGYSLFYFNKIKIALKPRLINIKKALAKDIFGLGAKFFLAQFFVLILHQSANIIITQVLSPADVTIYYIPLRLFSIISITMGLISGNLLPYFTEAKTQNDIPKMKLIINKFFKIFGTILVLFVIILVFSKPIIRIWTADQIEVPFSLLALHFLSALINGVGGIFSALLSGIGKLKKQILVLSISSIIFIPVSIILGKKMGLNGIVLALIISQVLILIVTCSQSIKYLGKNN